MTSLGETVENRQHRLAPQPGIALLHYTAPPVVGGVEAVLATQARLLSAAGYPVTVIAGRGGAEEAGAELGAGVRVQLIPEMVTRPGGDFAPPAAEFARAQARLEQALSQALRPGDLVIAHNILSTHFNLPLTAALLNLSQQRRLGRLIAWCHDLSRYVNPASGEAQRQGQPWDLLRQRRPEVTYVAVSHFRQRALATILGCAPAEIQVIPNGVDAAELLGLSPQGAALAEQFGLLAADLVLLLPVRLTRAKHIEFALQVTAALKAGGWHVRLVVTGPPDPHAADAQAYFGSLRALRRSLGLEAEAVFLGERPEPLPSARVAELYRLCDLLLMPSLREGFGMPVLEAGLAGKPVFATDIPVVQEVGRELVHLIGKDETPQAVAARIAAWAEGDPAQRLRRVTRQAYTWPAIFARCLEPLLAGSPQAAGSPA